MKLQIEFRNFEKPENQEHIAAIVEKYRALLPRWLDRLSVTIYDKHEDAPEGAICWISGQPEYGFAHLNILSRWLDRDADLQDELILHEILHIAHRREQKFTWERLLGPISERNEELYEVMTDEYRERNEEFINCLAQGIRALLGETEKETITGTPGYTICVMCEKDIHEKIARRCPKCFARPLCGKCARKHEDTCQKPSEIPDDVSYHCPKCGLSFVSSGEVMRHARSCQGVPPAPEDAAEVGPHLACAGCGQMIDEGEISRVVDGKRYHLNCKPAECFECGTTIVSDGVGGWTCPECSPIKAPKPSGKQVPEESKEMVAGYVKLSDLVFKHCHNNEGRLTALGLLHESMQAAISSIVCEDA